MRLSIDLLCDPNQAEKCAEELAQSLNRGSWVQLRPPGVKSHSIPRSLLTDGPGVLVASGGSSGGRQYCLQPSKHLDQSAFATAEWLKGLDIDPSNCIVLNPLPLHHVSGLMPWWRSRCWEVDHIWLNPSLMRDPMKLEKSCQKSLKDFDGSVLMSLVPIQLQRLLSNPVGVQWLQRCAVIWVGGGSLSDTLAREAREKGVRVSPCYGSTETAAMVTALSPQEFLSGINGCGKPLHDVELRISSDGALQVKTPRLAIARCSSGEFETLKDQEGWWTSGDSAYFFGDDCKRHLAITGRIDSAINSGGETVFPEQLEARLMAGAAQHGIPLECVLFLPIHDMEWGQRLVVLVRFYGQVSSELFASKVIPLQKIVAGWVPAERPIAWIQCHFLSPNSVGKWERLKWANWLDKKK